MACLKIVFYCSYRFLKNMVKCPIWGLNTPEITLQGWKMTPWQNFLIGIFFQLNAKETIIWVEITINMEKWRGAGTGGWGTADYKKLTHPTKDPRHLHLPISIGQHHGWNANKLILLGFIHVLTYFINLCS